MSKTTTSTGSASTKCRRHPARTVFAAAVLTALGAASASAHTTVTDAWVRGTVAQQTSSGVYAQITSAHGGRLVAVSTPAASNAEVHEMAMDGNVMRMHGAHGGGIELPAGKTVALKPGGFHVMLTGLKAPLRAGDVLPLTMVFEGADGKRETVQVKAVVRPLGQ